MTNLGFESPSFAADTLRDYSQASSREWLETNGLGGYASSSLSGAHTRGYHGLLVAATHPPAVRHVLLSRLDETVTIADTTVELSSRAYCGAVAPEGYRHLAYYTQEQSPSFTFEVHGACIVKTVTMLHGSNTVVIRYDLMLTERENEKIALSLRPFFAYRGYHERQSARGGDLGISSFLGRTLRFATDSGLPDTYIHIPEATWIPAPDWYYQFYYAVEAERGLPCNEDLFTPGTFEVTLSIGNPLYVILSTEKTAPLYPAELVENEILRRKKLCSALRKQDALTDVLVRASDQFVVRRGKHGRTIIAGYPWFTDWGRDTMIALPGTCLVTGRYEDAKAILSAFLEHVQDGLIPNRFPDIGEEPEYNTVDGTLWYFIAIWSYLRYSRDLEFTSSRLLPALLDIIRHHDTGTKFGIKVDSDGLLNAGDRDTQLTWMDARANGIAVTPRFGKAVEINALWYNALSITAEISRVSGRGADESRLRERAVKTRESFVRTFWSASNGYLYDCVNENGSDSALRPNQLLALSLPFPCVDENHATSILANIERHLLTPRGLRTLSPESPNYRGRYAGDGYWRDSAYHQGTVWPWLLGPYLTALSRFERDGRKKVEAYIHQFCTHLSEAGVGTVSEIFDGDEPQNAHGCMAQAWSVSELLRVYLEVVRGEIPPQL